METATNTAQEKMEAVISATWFAQTKFKETTNRQVGGIREDLDAEIQGHDRTFKR
jgi:hypothetical protein